MKTAQLTHGSCLAFWALYLSTLSTKSTRCTKKILMIVLVLILGTTSCRLSTLPKATINSTGAAEGEAVGTLVGQPELGASVGAGLGTVASESYITPTTEPVDDFWSLMAKLFEITGWLIGLLILVPLVLGYLIPNSTDRSAKKILKEFVTNNENVV